MFDPELQKAENLLSSLAAQASSGQIKTSTSIAPDQSAIDSAAYYTVKIEVRVRRNR